MFIAVGCIKNNTMVKETSEEYKNKIKNLEEKIKTLEADNEQIKDLQKKINSLEAENDEMKIQLDNTKKEKKNFNKLNHLAVKFVNAQTQGNIEKLNEVIGKEIELVEEQGNLYASGFMLHSKDNSLGRYEYMVIQTYEYIPEDDIYKINIRETYAVIPGVAEQIMHGLYVDLYIKEINGEWKITKLIVDV